MSERTIKISILAKGANGTGKSIALQTFVKAMMEDKRFKWIDSRFVEGHHWEEQSFELELIK